MADRLLIALLLLTVAALPGCNGTQAATPDARERVTINGQSFQLELALDDASRAKGLMRRERIDEDGGMLFVFPRPALQSFWMGHCLVDIDVAFLDARGRVVAIHTMKAQPPQRLVESEAAYRARMDDYPSVMPAQFAIELRAGKLDELGVKVGDRIELDLERLKAAAK